LKNGGARHCPAIGEFGVEFAVDAQQDVPFVAPVIGQVVARIFDHPHPDIPEQLCAPIGQPRLPLVLGGLETRPVRGAERNT